MLVQSSGSQLSVAALGPLDNARRLWNLAEIGTDQIAAMNALESGLGDVLPAVMEDPGARRHRFYSDTIQQYIETDQQLETSRAAYNTQAQRFNVLLQAVPRRWYAAYLRYEAVPLVGSRP